MWSSNQVLSVWSPLYDHPLGNTCIRLRIHSGHTGQMLLRWIAYRAPLTKRLKTLERLTTGQTSLTEY